MRLPWIRSLLLIGFLALLALATGTLAKEGTGQQAAGAAKGAKGAAAEQEWIVECSHSSAECQQALAEMEKTGYKNLSLWRFGCPYGEHKGWITVRAADEKTALEIVPTVLRSKAAAHRVSALTVAQLRALHEEKP